MEYPNVSILMPSYNRPHFLPLITFNLLNMKYDKSKLELCIIDDGKTPLFTTETLRDTRNTLAPLTINYIRETRRNEIGVKRNRLVKLAKHKICIMMDDDDIYFSTYIKHSIDKLKQSKSGLVGSNHMLFVYPSHNYKMSNIKCSAKRQIHEATMCFTKKYFRSMPGFVKSSRGEGASMIDFNEKNAEYTDIDKCMVCVSHSDNSIGKEQFYQYKIQAKIGDPGYTNILESITGIKYDPNRPDSDDETDDKD